MSSSSSSSSLAALKALLGRGEKETALAGCACVLSRGNVDGSVFLHHLLQMYLKGEDHHHNAPFVFLAPFGNRETQVASNFAFSLSPFPPLLPPPLLSLSFLSLSPSLPSPPASSSPPSLSFPPLPPPPPLPPSFLSLTLSHSHFLAGWGRWWLCCRDLIQPGLSPLPAHWKEDGAPNRFCFGFSSLLFSSLCFAHFCLFLLFARCQPGGKRASRLRMGAGPTAGPCLWTG